MTGPNSRGPAPGSRGPRATRPSPRATTHANAGGDATGKRPSHLVDSSCTRRKATRDTPGGHTRAAGMQGARHIGKATAAKCGVSPPIGPGKHHYAGHSTPPTVACVTVRKQRSVALLVTCSSTSSPDSSVVATRPRSTDTAAPPHASGAVFRGSRGRRHPEFSRTARDGRDPGARAVAGGCMPGNHRRHHKSGKLTEGSLRRRFYVRPHC